ncbi:MAG: TolC family protein [Candidatus Melainabacteria bacterium]|jgi:outer membrane protein|nr:TolC family protein [Candidatus Melainabacteria bacterium]MBX9671840.1 TolC family protein [Candidatus Obscuribacterales bacterium]
MYKRPFTRAAVAAALLSLHTCPAIAEQALTDTTILRPSISTDVQAFTLKGAITLAQTNYPAAKKARAQVEAAKINVKLQKINEYMPDSLLQYQQIMASHNKVTQIIYGSPVFPANPGAGPKSVNMEPAFSSGVGFNLDWAPLDFGLHKARIQLAGKQYQQSQAQAVATVFDAKVASAAAFFDVVEAEAQVDAAQENMKAFDDFRIVVKAQVDADLKPGADLSLAEAQLANARNQVLRAGLNQDISLAALANSVGLGGADVKAITDGLLQDPEQTDNGHPNLHTEPALDTSRVPILKAAASSVDTARAQRRVLDKEYYPVLHFMGGVQNRGSNLSLDGTRRTDNNAAGFLPSIPNYQIGVIVNWNFLDCFRIKQEKRIQDQRIIAQNLEYEQVLQNIKTESKQARARLATAISVARNTPVQVAAAKQAVSRALARYKVGLGSVAQVAEANQLLAQSRLQDAQAKVGVWRAMLAISTANGDLTPMIAYAETRQRKNR